MPDQVLPQIELTGSSVNLDPVAVLAHALNSYHESVRAEAEKRVLAGPLDLGADMLSAILMEVAGGHLNPFRIAAGVAFRLAAQEARDRALLPATQRNVTQDADDAAMNLGAYLAAQDANAVMEGYNQLVNAKVPRKEAARRAVRGFGLTSRSLRAAFRIKTDDAVTSSTPGAYFSKIEAFIKRSYHSRIKTVIAESLRKVEHDAVQDAWEEGLANGSITALAQKRWFTAEDERTCPICAPMDQVTIPITDSFKLPDGNRVKMPPVHVNCRCTVQLVMPEEVSKAWEEHEHPRAAHGRFGYKTKTVYEEAAARANAEALLAPLLAPGPNVTGPNRIAPSYDSPNVHGPEVGGGPRVAGGPAVNAGPVLGTQAGSVTGPAVRESAVIAGTEVNLRRLNMTHQMQVADTVAQNAAGRVAPRIPPEHLEPMGTGFVAFASEQSMNALYYSGASGERNEGTIQVEHPLRFVNRHSPGDVREALGEAMGELDAHLRDEPVEYEINDLGRAHDPGMAEAAADLRMAILSGKRTPKGTVVVAYAPEDAHEAWRAVLAPAGSGFSPSYEVDAYDETGTTVGTARVSAATLVAMTGVSPSSRVVPRVVVAPHGTWREESGLGATEFPPAGLGDKMVTGVFRWTHEHGTFIITPDDAAYRRAHPEQNPGT